MGKKKQQGRAKARGKAKQQQQQSSPGNNYAKDFARGSGRMLDGDEGNPHKMFRGFAQAGPRGNFSPHNANTNVKLRHQAITFVSASSRTPAEIDVEDEFVVVAEGDESSEEEEGEGEEMDEDDDEDEDLDDSAIQTNIVVDAEVELSQGAMGRMNIASPTSPEPPAFFVDIAGDPKLAAKATTNGKRPAVRSPSPARSDTSEEVVVFHGRSNAPKPQTNGKQKQEPNNSAVPAPSHTPHVTDDLLAALSASQEASRSTSPAKGWAAKPSRAQQQQQASSSDAWQPAPSTPYWRKGKPRPDLDPQPSSDAMLDDTPSRKTRVMFSEPQKEQNAEETISELQSGWKDVLREKRLAKSATRPPEDTPEPELVLGKKPSRRSKRGRKQSNRQLRNAILSDEEDNDDEAAYDDYMQNLAAQMDAGDGDVAAFTPINVTSGAIAGPSLVVDGKEIAENETLKHDPEDEWEDDDSSESEGPIGQDLSELSGEEPLNYSDLESTDLEDELEYTEREQWEDEEDIRQRRQDAMTDEQLARLLAKQEELGLGSEELLLDDGMYVDNEDLEGVGDLTAARAGLQDITVSALGSSSKRKPKRGGRSNNNDFAFPDASLLADTVEQYGENGFDIMDLDRPSLRTPKKGRKGKLPAELEEISDDELKDTLRESWENDRSKKRTKKAEREELRQQGLLGSAGRKGKADLSQKYLEGMTMKQVQDELRSFLQDEHQSRPFPPMGKADRKVLHEVANALNLKSKSVGAGKQRFAVLYKTSLTLDYEEAVLSKVCYAASKGFLSSSRRKGKKGKQTAGAFGSAKGPRGGRGGGFDKAAVNLRDGEVVGGAAKELGRENFGHRLMEKMGWQAGTALGKEGDGLLLPVMQVMRSGKAGLG